MQIPNLESSLRCTSIPHAVAICFWASTFGPIVTTCQMIYKNRHNQTGARKYCQCPLVFVNGISIRFRIEDKILSFENILLPWNSFEMSLKECVEYLKFEMSISFDLSCHKHTLMCRKCSYGKVTVHPNTSSNRNVSPGW